ncbi:MAG: TetR family transcriptional regulator [Paraglaciecola sp.]|uniref:TetR family transcriptional regulator n=1 Tax=Paraglaciecola sp. TaxID=1920173 RepID=UPI003296F0BB
MSSCLDQAESENLGALETIFSFTDRLLLSDIPEIAALSDVAYLKPEWQTVVKEMFVTLRDRIADILSNGIESGELRPCVPNVAAAATIGMVEWLPMASRWPTLGLVSKYDLIHALKTIIRVGVAADREAPANYDILAPLPLMIPAVKIFDTDVLASARREAILAKASWLFNLKGIDSTSLDEIADQLGVTRKVIYHNVGDKPTLVGECYRRSFKLYEQIAQRLTAIDGPKINMVAATAYANAEATLRTDIAPLEPLAGFEVVPDEVKDEISITTARLINTYLGIYEQGQAEGSIRNLNSRSILSMRPGTHEWLRIWIDTFSEEDISKAPREIAEITRIGLKAI